MLTPSQSPLTHAHRRMSQLPWAVCPLHQQQNKADFSHTELWGFPSLSPFMSAWLRHSLYSQILWDTTCLQRIPAKVHGVNSGLRMKTHLALQFYWPLQSINLPSLKWVRECSTKPIPHHCFSLVWSVKSKSYSASPIWPLQVKRTDEFGWNSTTVTHWFQMRVWERIA